MNTSKVNECKYCAVYDWMLDMKMDSTLELYLYAGIYGVTSISGAWRGSKEKLVSYFKLTKYSQAKVDGLLKSLINKGYITVSDWTYPSTYEFKAIVPSPVHNLRVIDLWDEWYA